jgi:acyl carrier protein
LEALPKSVGGKLDRKRLPKLELSSRLDNADELDGMAAILAARFAKVLGLTSQAGSANGVGLDNDFFLELGGDSLAAAELVSLLREDPRTEAICMQLARCAAWCRCARTQHRTMPPSLRK